MRAYHGTAVWNVAKLLEGKSTVFGGLSVTDTAERAQLYADAQATREVSEKIRRAAGSAVVELEVGGVKWIRRPASHGTLDTCEATVKTWQIAKVTVYASAYDLENSAAKIEGRYQNPYKFLQERLGDKVEIIVV